jgi:hypothetical protein
VGVTKIIEQAILLLLVDQGHQALLDAQFISFFIAGVIFNVDERVANAVYVVFTH